MSVKISKWIWRQPLKGQQKLVLLALADFADNDGCCSASFEEIALKCGLGRSTTARHLQWLRQHEFLQVRHQFHKSGARECNVYQIMNIE